MTILESPCPAPEVSLLQLVDVVTSKCVEKWPPEFASTFEEADFIECLLISIIDPL